MPSRRSSETVLWECKTIWRWWIGDVGSIHRNNRRVGGIPNRKRSPHLTLRCEQACTCNELQPQKVTHKEDGGPSFLCTVRCLIRGELTNRSHALEKWYNLWPKRGRATASAVRRNDKVKGSAAENSFGGYGEFTRKRSRMEMRPEISRYRSRDSSLLAQKITAAPCTPPPGPLTFNSGSNRQNQNILKATTWYTKKNQGCFWRLGRSYETHLHLITLSCFNGELG